MKDKFDNSIETERCNPDEIIRVVVIDDDLPSAQLLVRNLSRRENVEVCGVAEDLYEGEEMVRQYKPHILFLDMAFPDSNGLEWYENADLPECTKVVFHTCYRRYIHDALSLKVFDFLLKPFLSSDLDVILRRYRNLTSDEKAAAENPESSILDVVPGKEHQPTVYGLMSAELDGREAGHYKMLRPLAITTVTNSKVIVNPAEIVYFHYMSDRKLWECVFSNLKRFILKRQTTAEIILAYGTDFVRTHKHYIVNIRYVGVIAGNECTLLPPLDGITEIKISKSYRRELLDRFYDI